ncbi:hypothetical protein [Saccharothrix australiensis]|uniref:LppP/LprE lipoprotein n=1 Tax=Saccharothrix australiensis TaxID=2072 RepID=A0A495W3Q3_9PSEU|nr:hypothetical protein [Saccharothrix australiensis]RKT56306.1 hypothetical protein C8E97_5002 [Saccharothrix australiensis]
MSHLRAGLALAAVVALSGCGAPAGAGSDGVLSLAPPPPSPTPTGPTFVPASGQCQVTLNAPEPTAAATTQPTAQPDPGGPTTTRALPGDMPPNHADNRSWRVRKPLSPENHARGLTLAERVRPELAALCDAGNFAQDATRAAFAAAGHPEVWVTGMKSFSGDTPPAGVVFNATLADPAQGTACVLGLLQPGSVAISVLGTTGEGSCVEPDSH